MATEAVFAARGPLRASSASGLERHLLRHPGVLAAEANPVAQQVAVRHDGHVIGADGVEALIRDFGWTCGGEIVPCHLCRDETPAVEAAHAGHVLAHPDAGHPAGEMAAMAHEMGHGAGMSMAAMVRDMRNRFLVAVNALLLKRTKLEGIRRYGAG